jgi:FAD:protein FMN transferase
MFRFQHTAMATQFEIRCTHQDERYARHAARTAFEAVDRLEQQLSRFVENSDISRINKLSAGESTIVGYETMQCLQLAALMYGETGGAFDIAIGTGFESLELIPVEFLVIARPWHAEARRAKAAAEGVRLDLGAIGKGYAVDRVADVLEDWEVDHALIDAGCSSVLALEPPALQEDWALTLSEPGDTGTILARIGARQRALGASGTRKGGHIVNPRDLVAVRSRSAAWVSAPRSVLAGISLAAGVEASPAAVADALSTAFMIGAVDDIDSYCREHPGLEAWTLDGTLTRFPTAESPCTG